MQLTSFLLNMKELYNTILAYNNNNKNNDKILIEFINNRVNWSPKQALVDHYCFVKSQ